MKKRDGDQLTIAFAYRTTDIYDTKRSTALDLLQHILAGPWISLLTQKLRVESNITYWPGGYTEYFSDTGYLRIQFTVQKDDFETVLSLVNAEISNLIEGNITKKQLENHKESHVSSILLSDQTVSNQAWWHGWQSALDVKEIQDLASFTLLK